MIKFPASTMGAFYMLLSALCYVASASILREFGDKYSSFQLTFIRSLIAAVIVFPIFFQQRKICFFLPNRFIMHIAVAGFSYLGILFWFKAATILPVGDLFALQFTTPLFTIVFAIIFLREKFDLPSCFATLIGFFGVLIVLRPGILAISFGAIAALFSSVGYASANTVIKSLSRNTSVTTIVFFGNLFLVPIALPMAVYNWTSPSLNDWPAIIGVSCLSTLGYFSITKGISLAPAQLVQPVNFMRMPLAALAGWIFFSELPDFWTWIGTIVIFISTTFAVRRGAAKH